MVLAWGFFAIAGNFVARYSKPSHGPWWFRIHVVIMSFTVLLTAVGFALIVSFVQDIADNDPTKEHFDGAHQCIGLIIVFLTMIQPSLGVISDRLYHPWRDRTPIFPDMTHHWLGRLILVLGIINIGLGMDLYCVNKPAFGIYMAAIPFIVLVMISFELFRWFAPWGWWVGGGWLVKVRNPSDLRDSCFGELHAKKDREKHEVPMVLKIIILAVQYTAAVILLGLFIAIAVELGTMTVPNPDPYYSSCNIIS